MIVGIGIDIVNLDRMKLICEKQEKIYKYILAPKEIEIYKAAGKKGKLKFLAGRFAVKEAFSKAMGTGIGKQVNFQNISVVNNEKGEPIIVDSPFDGNIFVTISHSEDIVIAQVVLGNKADESLCSQT